MHWNGFKRENVFGQNRNAKSSWPSVLSLVQIVDSTRWSNKKSFKSQVGIFMFLLEFLDHPQNKLTWTTEKLNPKLINVRLAQS